MVSSGKRPRPSGRPSDGEVGPLAGTEPNASELSERDQIELEDRFRWIVHLHEGSHQYLRSGLQILQLTITTITALLVFAAHFTNVRPTVYITIPFIICSSFGVWINYSRQSITHTTLAQHHEARLAERLGRAAVFDETLLADGQTIRYGGFAGASVAGALILFSLALNVGAALKYFRPSLVALDFVGLAIALASLIFYGLDLVKARAKVQAKAEVIDPKEGTTADPSPSGAGVSVDDVPD